MKRIILKKKKNVDFITDLRPKGRGRPQRILLGVWPDEHIRGVIRAVVFRDGNSPHLQIKAEEPATMYPALANYGACNGPEGAVSPSAAAAAVAAVAQGEISRRRAKHSRWTLTLRETIQTWPSGLSEFFIVYSSWSWWEFHLWHDCFELFRHPFFLYVINVLFRFFVYGINKKVC